MVGGHADRGSASCSTQLVPASSVARIDHGPPSTEAGVSSVFVRNTIQPRVGLTNRAEYGRSPPSGCHVSPPSVVLMRVMGDSTPLLTMIQPCVGSTNCSHMIGRAAA
jgi:hypothetical protein